MKRKTERNAPQLRSLPKAPTGVKGLDEITGGGLPRGRATLVAGGPGTGKTVLGTEFLVRGILDHAEPGVFVSFQETSDELVKNFASLGFDLKQLVARKRLLIDQVHVDRANFLETGAYNLEGLFVRLGEAIRKTAAKRVVLDAIDSLFDCIPKPEITRAEIQRLFAWLKASGVTTIVTAERGNGGITRHGLEEYLSDCVLFLDHRVAGELSTRRLRVMKYRGSQHGTNEYPFLIGDTGLFLLPVTELKLEHEAPPQRVSTGVPALDDMLGGRGYYRGSSVLITGTPGSGKTSLAASFVDAGCRRGERCLFLAFEESAKQVLRNMRSIGIDLERHVRKGLLEFVCTRPSRAGLEFHLVSIALAIDAFRPSIVVVDPISSLAGQSSAHETLAMGTRLVDHLKSHGITSLFTALIPRGADDRSTVGISSIMDTWLLLSERSSSAEENFALYVLKSRGDAHSHQVREFLLTDRGVELVETYPGPGGVLFGSARLTQEAEDKARELALRQDIHKLRRSLGQKRKSVEAEVAALRSDFEKEEAELLIGIREGETRLEQLQADRRSMGRYRSDGRGSGRRARTRPPSPAGRK